MKKILLILAALLNASIAYSGQTACPQFFVGGSAPEETNPKASVRKLCNEEYSVGHSGKTRSPLWGAERMTRESIEAGKGLPRKNNFRPDPRLPVNERSELRDFAKSGYDRGHLFASRNASTGEAQSESFYLSNVVVQDRENNQNLWEGIEFTVRTLAKSEKDIFIITGPIFAGSDKALKGRVHIPSAMFKCLYLPLKNQGGCYAANNSPGMDYNIASISQVEQTIGINLFPAIPQAIKDSAITLPAPVPYSSRMK